MLVTIVRISNNQSTNVYQDKSFDLVNSHPAWAQSSCVVGPPSWHVLDRLQNWTNCSCQLLQTEKDLSLKCTLGQAACASNNGIVCAFSRDWNFGFAMALLVIIISS